MSEKIRKEREVAVVIPTYNRREFVCEAVDSVLVQTFENFELVVIDDGSQDGTFEEVEKRYDDPRLKVVRQENLGVSAARNRGARETSAPLVAFLDSDDYWKPEKLEVQLRVMEAHPEAAACHTEEVWYRRGKWANPCRHHAKSSGEIFEECLPLCIISPSSVVIRRRVFDEACGFDEKLPACEDYDLWLRLSARYPIHLCEEKVTVKRNGHEGQLSADIWGLDRFRVAALWKIYYDVEVGADKRKLALEWIIKKAKVVAGGARKRGAFDRQKIFNHSVEEAKRCLEELER